MLHVITNRTTPKPSQDSILYAFEIPNVADERSDTQILNGLFIGRAQERIVRSHWAAYPSLREASIALLNIIGTQWRSSLNQSPLIVECIEAATAKAVRVVQEEGASGRLVVSAYLGELADTAVQIAQFSTFGIKGGQKQRWQPLSVEIERWARESEITSIQVEEGAHLDQCSFDGYRSVILSRIASPAEVGLVLRSSF